MTTPKQYWDQVKAHLATLEAKHGKGGAVYLMSLEMYELTTVRLTTHRRAATDRFGVAWGYSSLAAI